MSHPSRRICLHLWFLLLVCASCSTGAAGGLTVPHPREPRCAPGFEIHVPAVLADRGVTKISTYFPEGEAGAQLARYPSRLCPSRALGLAVGALLASEAPEALSRVGAEIGAAECDARCYLDRRSSLLGLVTDRSSVLAHRLLPDVPTGERVADNWVFFLSVPDLSEHGYWALVARDGSGVEVVAQN